MNLAIVTRKGLKAVERRTYVRSEEVMAYCPGCKDLETIWLENNRLLSTRKYTQVGSLIYHNCGSIQPCHLFSNH
jgi:hypothetical protein